MLTHTQARQIDDFQNLLACQVQGDFQFPQNKVVVQSLLGFRLWSFLFPSFIVYQTIEENRQLCIGAILEGWIVILFQPIAYLFAGNVITGELEERHHFRVVQIEGVTDTP